MSTISNIHTAIVYEAKGPNKSVAQFGQRGVVTIAKADKFGNYGEHLQQTMFTSIPSLTRTEIDFTNPRIQDHAVEYFKSIQNQIIAQNLKSGKKEITTEQLSEIAICQFLEEEGNSEKWDSNKIASWFNDNLAEFIGVALIEKGFSDEKLESSLVAYSKLFADSFSSKSAIPRIKAEAIRKALKIVEKESIANDSQYCKFKARIDKILDESSLDELFGL